MFKLDAKDKERLNEMFKGMDCDELNEVLDAIKEYKEEFDKRKEVDLTKVFSRNCKLTVEVRGDEDNRTSEVEVNFKGCKGVPDVLVLGVAAMHSIAEQFPDKKVEIMAHICSLALAGEHAGIYKSREDLLESQEEEE